MRKSLLASLAIVFLYASAQSAEKIRIGFPDFFDREMAAATYDSVVKTYGDDLSVPESGFRLLIDEAKKAANLSREVSLSEVADLSLLREAQRELGIIGR